MIEYEIIKTVHVLSAMALVGTGLGIAFFCWFGSRSALASCDIAALRLVLRFTVLADAVFTAPAVVVQFASGVWLVRQAGREFNDPWTVTVLALFVAIGACWLPVVAIQIRLTRMADSASETGDLPPQFHGLFRIWFALGLPAFGMILVLLVLMVTRRLPWFG